MVTKEWLSLYERGRRLLLWAEITAAKATDKELRRRCCHVMRLTETALADLRDIRERFN